MRAQREAKEEKERMPKKPRSSYLFYCEEIRDGLKLEHPECNTIEIAKLMGEAWKGLTDDESQR